MRKIILIIVCLVAVLFTIFLLESRFNFFAPEFVQAPAELKLDLPQPDEYIQSPYKVSGYAPERWFINNSFPITLTNWDGLIIFEGNAFVAEGTAPDGALPFSATLVFVKPSYGDNGFLILARSNPERDPKQAEHFEIQIKFK